MNIINKPNCCAADRNSLTVKSTNNKATTRLNCSSTTDTQSIMSLIPGGNFKMGTNTPLGYPEDGETPIRKMNIQPIYMDIHAVTNNQFKEFGKTGQEIPLRYQICKLFGSNTIIYRKGSSS